MAEILNFWSLKLDIGKRFDKVAKEYDTPDKLERSEKVVSFILNSLPVNKNWKVLDFGCGTGTTSLLLSPYVKSIIGVDLSKGMLDIFNEKIQKFNIRNINILNKDILNTELDEKDFDLLITAMTFHHLDNIEKSIKNLSKYIKKNGYLVIIDLEKEDGTFHSDNTDVKHFGFSPQEIQNWFKNSELEIKTLKTIYEIEKERDGKVRKYPIFIVISKKNQG
jgi:ubiquinone/menaquinone biosynthesis C-methylase UbiE